MINEAKGAPQKRVDEEAIKRAFAPIASCSVAAIESLAGDRVMVKLEKLEDEKKLPSGLVLPQTRDKSGEAAVRRGKVVGFGPGFTTHFAAFVSIHELVPGLAIGKTVAFSRNGAQEAVWQIDGDEYVVVRSAEIVAVLRG